METKVLEVRDRSTFIPVVAVRPGSATYPQERWLLRQAGYNLFHSTILLTRASGDGRACSDPYDWNDRTLTAAHQFIEENWAKLEPGAVVDVEFIMGEKPEAKRSQSEETGQ